jgi:hypothetical protein
LEHNLVNSNAGVLVFVVSQQLKKLKSLIWTIIYLSSMEVNPNNFEVEILSYLFTLLLSTPKLDRGLQFHYNSNPKN